MKIILFDGVCNLCNHAVNFIIKKDANKVFYFASLQSNYAQKLVATKNIKISATPETIVLVDEDKCYQYSDAVLHICQHLGYTYSWLYVFIIIPKFLRDAAYKIIAKYRYKIWGKSATCRIPTPNEKERFL